MPLSIKIQETRAWRIEHPCQSRTAHRTPSC